MKINTTNLPEIENKLKKLNLVWNIRETNNSYVVSFEDIEIKEGGCLISAWESAITLEDAKVLYLNRILDEILISKAYSDDRREILLSVI
jgi:hypothetical protein